jgi:hypothetical protein
MNTPRSTLLLAGLLSASSLRTPRSSAVWGKPSRTPKTKKTIERRAKAMKARKARKQQRRAR